MKVLKYIFFSMLIAGVFTSCTNWVNTNDALISPNAATDAPASTILTHVLATIIQSNEGTNARYANMFTQHFRGLDRQHNAYDQYNMTNQNFQWDEEYQQIIHQANIIITKADEASNVQLRGVAKLAKAWTFGTLTSLFGDIPFNEADNLEKFPNPAFDDQVTVVYPGIQALLDEAIADLTGAGGFTGDFFFSGDAAKWTAAAHTLKARYYLHMGDYANAASEAAQGINATANNVLAPHSGGTIGKDANLWGDFIANQRTGDYGVGASFLEAMLKIGGAKNNAKTNESARYLDFFTADGSNINTSTSTIFALNASFPLITYEENQLILAEAQIRQNDKAGALATLNTVRTALAAKYAAGTYTAYVDADFATNADLLTEILRERYVSLTGQIEVFNDFRRTNNPFNIPQANAAAAGFPGRFLYPSTEDQSNSSTPTGITLFDMTKVFGGSK